LAGAPLPPRKIDGHDIRPLLLGESQARSPWDDEGFFYYFMEQLQAVRAGPWKLYLPLTAKYVSLARRTEPAALALYNVRSDVGETREVSAEHPEVVARLQAMAAHARLELGDMGQVGRGQRPAARSSTRAP